MIILFCFVGKKTNSILLVDDQKHLYTRVYQKKNETGGYRSLWRCIVNKVPKCPATATTKKATEEAPEVWSSFGPNNHNHVADHSKVVKQIAVGTAKKAALEQPNLKPRVVFGSLASNLENMGEVVPVKYNNLARSISRVRSSLTERPRTPISFQDVLLLLPDNLKYMLDGTIFLVYAGPVMAEEENVENVPNNESQPNMLIFMSPHGKERLRVSPIWLCDGTFKSAPLPYMQVLGCNVVM